MSQQLGIVKGDALQRLGSLGFIIGAILLIVFNALFPRAADPRNISELVSTWGDSVGLVTLSVFFISVGMWLIMIGAAGVYRSISAGGAAWARLGFYKIIVGTVIWSLSNSLAAATAAASAGGLTDVAITILIASSPVFTMAILVEWLAIFFLGIGMVRSAIYPKWQGWAGLILGILTFVVVGIPQFFGGITGALQTIFAVLAGLTTIWALIVGIWIARRAW